MSLISVIIPHFRQEEQLEKCLEALENQTLNTGLYEIIVVHNETHLPESLAKLADKYCNLIIKTEGKPGSYAARNLGIKAANSKYLAFTDSDCTPSTNWLEKAVEEMESFGNVCRIGGRINIVPPHGNELDWCYLYETVYEFRQDRSVRNGSAVTANLIAHHSLFSNVGLFEDSLKSGGDKEWNLRCANAGVPIKYADSVVVGHPSRNSIAEICRKYRRTYGGWFYLYGWHNKGVLIRLFLTLYALRPPIRPVIELIRAKPGLVKFVKVLSVLLVIRLARVYEHIRLATGKQPLR